MPEAKVPCGDRRGRALSLSMQAEKLLQQNLSTLKEINELELLQCNLRNKLQEKQEQIQNNSTKAKELRMEAENERRLFLQERQGKLLKLSLKKLFHF